MSRSNKARHGMKTKSWKGTMQTSRVDNRARSSWKKLGHRAERRTADLRTGRVPKVARQRTGKFEVHPFEDE